MGNPGDSDAENPPHWLYCRGGEGSWLISQATPKRQQEGKMKKTEGSRAQKKE